MRPLELPLDLMEHHCWVGDGGPEQRWLLRPGSALCDGVPAEVEITGPPDGIQFYRLPLRLLPPVRIDWGLRRRLKDYASLSPEEQTGERWREFHRDLARLELE